MAISMLKIRRPLGRLIFNMGIAIPGKTVFLIETAPWLLTAYAAHFAFLYPFSPACAHIKEKYIDPGFVRSVKDTTSVKLSHGIFSLITKHRRLGNVLYRKRQEYVVYKLNEAEWCICASINYPLDILIMACCLFGAKPLTEPMLE